MRTGRALTIFRSLTHPGGGESGSGGVSGLEGGCLLPGGGCLVGGGGAWSGSLPPPHR